MMKRKRQFLLFIACLVFSGMLFRQAFGQGMGYAPGALRNRADKEAFLTPPPQKDVAEGCWKVEEKKVASESMTGETIIFGENSITASVDPPLKPLTNIKLIFDFCVDAHCFDDIYAKVLSVEENQDKTVNRLRITSPPGCSIIISSSSLYFSPGLKVT